MMCVPDNSVLAERSWSIMNLIMNKTRNSLTSVNVNKLMYIYINERTLNRLRELKRKLQFAEIQLEKEELCHMEDRILEEEIRLFDLE